MAPPPLAVPLGSAQTERGPSASLWPKRIAISSRKRVFQYVRFALHDGRSLLTLGACVWCVSRILRRHTECACYFEDCTSVAVKPRRSWVVRQWLGRAG